MKLLFDQNLSSRLVHLLADVFPGSVHVRDAGMMEANDQQVWEFAMAGGFAIVSKDGDFFDLAALAENGPKIIWIQLGNCTTPQVESLLRMRASAILAFSDAKDERVLVLP